MKKNNGNYVSNSTVKITATETSRKLEFEIPNEEADNITAGVIKNNHLRGMYHHYCILNQEFLDYVVSCKLTAVQSRMLFFLMAGMDKENRVLLNNEILVKELKATEKSIIDATKRLESLRIIIRQKLGTGRYEYQIQNDMLNPQMVFKNKASKENVKKHKALIRQESPYIKQYNTDGDIDLINQETGEIFKTQKVYK
jgi:hypothetical protein